MTFPTEQIFLIPMGPQTNRSFVKARVNCLSAGRVSNNYDAIDNLPPLPTGLPPALPRACSWRPLHEDDDSDDKSRILLNATHCSHAGLTAFPDNLPTNVQELFEPFLHLAFSPYGRHLGHNEIPSMPSFALDGLPHLMRLYCPFADSLLISLQAHAR